MLSQTKRADGERWQSALVLPSRLVCSFPWSEGRLQTPLRELGYFYLSVWPAGISRRNLDKRWQSGLACPTCIYCIWSQSSHCLLATFSQTYVVCIAGAGLLAVCVPTSDDSRASLAHWTVLCPTGFCLLWLFVWQLCKFSQLWHHLRFQSCKSANFHASLGCCIASL